MTPDLQEFHDFVGEKLKIGESMMSPEKALDEWRDQHPDSMTEDDLAAIKEALDDVDRGDKGVPFDEFIREFRAPRMDSTTGDPPLRSRDLPRA